MRQTKPKYWLMKSEPTDYSIDNLKHDRKASWDGVRNYQARNFMRDEMHIGNKVLFYHSNINPGIVGLGEVCSRPYPDHTAFKKGDKHYDPKSKRSAPTWYMVDVCFKGKFKEPLSLQNIKKDPALTDMLVVKRGVRLSIQPVEKKHYERIVKYYG